MTTPLLIEWTGAGLGLLGAGLLATNSRWSAYGWLAFLLSNACWISYAVMVGAWGLWVQQVGFTATSLFGLWRWRAELRRTPGGQGRQKKTRRVAGR